MKQLLFNICLGFVLGGLTLPFLQPNLNVTHWLFMLTLLVLTGIALWVAIIRLRAPKCQKQFYKKAFLSYLLRQCLVFILGLVVGMVWMQWHVLQAFQWQLPFDEWRNPTQVQVKILSLPEKKGERLRFDACLLETLRPWPQAPKGCSTRLRLYEYVQINKQSEIHSFPKPGEVWQFEVRLRPVSSTLNPGLFDFQYYLSRQSIRWTGSVKQGKRLSVTPQWHYQYWRYRIYSYFHDYREQVPSLGIILALTLGERQWIPDAQWQSLQITGLAHLMAISGLHLSLVFMGAWWLLQLIHYGLSFLSRMWILQPLLISKKAKQPSHISLYIAWIIALLYASLAGFSVSTVRAFLFVTVFVCSRVSQCPIKPSTLFLYAVTLVILVDPFAFMDAGFWLSAGAVLAIFLYQWRLKQTQNTSQGWKKLIFYVWELCRFEWMLLLALAPLSILLFHGIPWLSPISNVVMVPVFTFFVLPLSLLSLLPTLIESPVAFWLWRTIDSVVQPLFYLNQELASWHYAWFEVTDKKVAFLFICFCLAWLLPFKKRYQIFIGVVLSMLALPFAIHPVHEDFAVHVLDVGQGSAIVIQRQEYALLFDAGPAFFGGLNTGETVVLPVLHYLQLSPEWLVLSHDHLDHTGGHQILLEQYPQMQFMGSGIGDIACMAGLQWRWQDVHIQALAPFPGPSLGKNNDSCVLLLTYQGTSVLLSGDIEQQTELRLATYYGDLLHADILMVPHHGGKTSSQSYFLEQVQPYVAVISRGFANQFRMPALEVLERYNQHNTQVYDTGKHGLISLIWDEKQGWFAKTQRPLKHLPWYHHLPDEVKKE